MRGAPQLDTPAAFHASDRHLGAAAHSRRLWTSQRSSAETTRLRPRLLVRTAGVRWVEYSRGRRSSLAFLFVSPDARACQRASSSHSVSARARANPRAPVLPSSELAANRASNRITAGNARTTTNNRIILIAPPPPPHWKLASVHRLRTPSPPARKPARAPVFPSSELAANRASNRNTRATHALFTYGMLVGASPGWKNTVHDPASLRNVRQPD
ncbi:hypothetical protein HETIRDRAFT_450383 [Heterobasidion irregulare TC 32-1]|uniref:Uncharacterized protein n=1 Tax=Heterobasidion irregulare (strain TC 32-1) TaxID=747525 RepID=W4K9U2_HETIT|nr:uncharacterized protein HETIRDRAFT_450383 [Heterobasidion irregulare TC 32-1]ETW82548.1 hypothetical protein HETIRDRAFT_450383 [Heterobasidion irregulare TC 32-1]